MIKLKKFKRRISMLLATIMVAGLIQVPLPANAEGITTNVESTNSEEAAKLLESIKNVAPTISSDGSKIVLPQIDSDTYEVKLYGSSNESVIGMDGTIYKPLEDMIVSVMYQVVNKNDSEDVAVDNFTEVSVVIPGQYKSEEGDNSRPQVLPAIREWKGHEGNFTLTDESRIVISDESLKDTADMIAYYFKEMLGSNINIIKGIPRVGDIFVSLNDKSELGEEGYIVEIGDIVSVEAYKAKGVLYAGTTLTQILSQDENHEILPKGLIRDYPQYEVRSCMLDVARFYMPIDYLEEFTKYMAYYKLNEIRVHINDGGGEQHVCFRLESKLYPEINSSVPKEEIYTQEQYRNYQKEVSKFGIDVVTEIDTPGHSNFIALYDPSLTLYGQGGSMDVKNSEAVEFVKSLYDEFLDGEDPVIQSDTIHIGGDEYMDNDPNYNEYQEATMDYIVELSEHIKSKGIKCRMWNQHGSTSKYPDLEKFSTDIPLNYAFYQQANYDETIEAGFKCINSEADYLYIVPGIADGWAKGVSLSDLYNSWEATKLGGGCTITKASPLMIGAEPCLWNDKKAGCSQFDLFDVFKKLLMLVSEKTWYGEKTEEQTAEEFLDRVDKLGDKSPGANPARIVDSNDSLVASYDFEELNDIVIKDNSTNGYDAELNSLNVINDNGNNVVELNGEGYISLPFSSLGYPYTISFDLYVDDATPENSVLFNGEDGTLYLNYQGTGKIAYERKGYTYIFDFKIDTDMWQNITISCNNKHTTMYIDGYEVANGEYYKVSGAHEFASSTFILPTEKIGEGVIGKLDNLILYNECFSSDKIMGKDFVPYENLALNKPVEVSGLEVDDGRCTGEMAVDGDSGTRVSFHYEDKAWLTVDLKGNCLVDRIEIEWIERPSKYQVYVSEDGENWDMVFEDLNCIPKSNGTEAIALDSPMKVRYVKYQQVEKYGSFSGTFAELKVFGADIDFDTILNDAKAVLAETVENENNKAFLKRFSNNITLFEKIISAGNIQDIAWTGEQIKKQTEAIKAGNTYAEEVDTVELEELLGETLNEEIYTKNSLDMYKLRVNSGKKILFDMSSNQSKIDEAVERIESAKNGLELAPLVTATTNMNKFSDDYNIEKLVDGDLSTMYWSGSNQKVNDYIQFKFREKTSLSSVRIISNSYPGDALELADFQVSEDGEEWTTVGTLTHISDQTIKFDVSNIKYARIILTENMNHWLGINEVIFDGGIFVDTSVLEAELSKNVDEEKYTADSFEKYLEARRMAEEVLLNDKKTNEDIKTALAALQQAEADLVEIVDKSSLEELVFELEREDLSKYTEISRGRLEEALASANVVLNDVNATNKQVVEAYEKLTEAKAALVLVIEGIDTKKLEEELDNNYDKAQYTKASFEAYEKEVEAARKLLQSEDITQKDVDEAVANLKAAKEALRVLIIATSNMNTPDEYKVSNTVDGDLNTKFWTYNFQTEGLYIDFEFARNMDLTSVQVISEITPSDSIASADIKVSQDGTNWTKVGELEESRNQTVEISATNVKYVRIELTSGKNNCVAIDEVIFGGSISADIIDTAELKSLISEIEAMDLTTYTEDSVNALNTSLESAKAVLNDANATQSQVDEALANLTAAKEGLVLKANKTLLKQTIAQADALVEEGALEGVNTIVVENFNKALENAKEVEANENATQEEVNDAWKNLAEAIQMLDFKTDKTELNALIAECEALDLNKYEDEGKEEFQNALDYAKEIAAREDVLTEESIKEAIDRLTAAKEALVEKPAIDTSILEYLYNTVKDTDLTKYIDEGKDEFKAALENAKNVLDNPESQEQVDEAVRRLNNAYINLRLKASEETLRKLQSFVTEAENIDESLYSAETLAMIQEVKNEVNMALADPNLTEDSAEKLLVKVEKAKVAIANPDGENNTENPENPENPNNQGNSGETNNTGNGDSGNNNNQGNVNGSNNEGKGNAVSTGDYSNIGLLSISLLVSLAGVTIFVGKKRKIN